MKKYLSLIAFTVALGAAASIRVEPADYLEPDFVPAHVTKMEKHDDAEGVEYIDVPVTVDYSHIGEERIFNAVYSDEIFFKPSTEYHHLLAKQSIGLALSAFTLESDEEDEEAINAPETEGYLVEYLTNCDFEDIRIDDYFKDTSIYTVGSAIGRKTIHSGADEAELIVIAIRGGHYKNEWQSNFTVGSELRHKGFNDAATLVTDRLISYIGQRTFAAPLKIWISGYSRAGAIANLVAANLNDSSILSKDQVYAYTFAAPRPVWNDPDDPNPAPFAAGYENIFNIVGASDFIPQFVPHEWGYYHYGTELYLPGAEFDSGFAEKYAVVQDEIAALGGQTYYNVNLLFRTRMLFGLLLEVVKNDWDFVDLLQPAVVSILQDKRIENALLLFRNTLIQWGANDPTLRTKKDAIIDYLMGFLPPLLSKTSYMKGQTSSGKNPLLNLAHEHFTELYIHYLYAFDAASLYSHNNHFAYVILDGDGRFTVRDTATNQDVLAVENRKVTRFEGAPALSAFIIKKKTIIALPYDRDYEVRYAVAEGDGFHSVIVPYGRSFVSKLERHDYFMDADMDLEGTLLTVQDGTATYAGSHNDCVASNIVKYLRIDQAAFSYRVTLTLLIFAAALGVAFMAWVIVQLRCKIRKNHLNPVRMGIISLLIVSIMEGGIAYWVLSDLIGFSIIFKVISGLCILAIYMLKRKWSELKQMHKTIMPALLAFIVGNVLLTINYVAGLALFLASFAYLCYCHLRGRKLKPVIWIGFALVTAAALAVGLLLVKPITASSVMAILLVPIALFNAFISPMREGKKEIACYLLFVAFFALALFIHLPRYAFLLSSGFVFLFHAALALHAIQYDRVPEALPPTEEEPEEAAPAPVEG